MAKHGVYLTVMLLLLLGVSLQSCSKEQKRMRRDRHWAKEYLNSIGREHYTMVLIAASQSKMVTRIPNKKQKDYDFESIIPSRSVETIKLLSRMGLDMEYRHEGKTPLMWATQSKQVSIVTALLKLGANPLAKDDKGNSVLSFAQDHQELTKIIEEAISDITNNSFDVASHHVRKADSTYSTPKLAQTVSSEPEDSLLTPPKTQYKYKAILKQTGVSVASVLIDTSSPHQKGATKGPILSFAPLLKYPESAKQSNTSGTVMLELDVLPNGRVKTVVVTQSLGAELDSAAIAAAKESRFEPARKEGFPSLGKAILEARFERIED